MTDAASTTENRTLAQTPSDCPMRPTGQGNISDRCGGRPADQAARKRGRNGDRDACAILLAYRHGLRASELCQLRWAQFDLRQGRLHVNRAKGGGGERASVARTGAEGTATVAGGEPRRVRHRSRDTGNPALVPADDPADGRGRQAAVPSASAHAAACPRLRAGQ